MTDADTVYGSCESLYLATPRWMEEDLSVERQARGRDHPDPPLRRLRPGLDYQLGFVAFR